MKIEIKKAVTPKEKPKGALGFGRNFTDHMFIMDYTNEKGWHDARIIPYGDLSVSPASMVFHYGQETFEGMKAYKNADGSCYLFRPEENAKRHNSSNARMCIPEIPVDDYVTAVKTLVKLDEGWIPAEGDGSLYIRPFFIADDPFVGVAISDSYKFIIIAAPCDAYFGTLKPVSILIEENYVRAVRGGTGKAKAGGNYGASMAALERAKKAGCAQVMWLDGIERKYIEEVGTMNIFFKIDGKIVTPALNESILSGITRNSIIALCKDFGLTVEERAISIGELKTAAENGKLQEAFGTGTAVVVSPVSKFIGADYELVAGKGEVGETTRLLYDTLTSLQRGDSGDKFNWRVKI